MAAGAAAVSGCPSGTDNTGVGGVLVVAQVQVDAGSGIVLVGGTRQLQAIPRTSTGIVVPGKQVAWSSANPDRAMVDAGGMVQGVAPGVAAISATVDGVVGRVNLQVLPVPVAVVEVVAGITAIEAGQTALVQAVAKDSAGGILDGRTVAWSSSNTTVATVSSEGVVTGMGAGTATITATIEGRSAGVLFTVTARPATRLGFLVQPSAATAGLAIAPPIQVAFQDEAGGTATSATGTITLAFSANPTGATLGGTLTAAAVQGVAIFSDVRVNRAGQPYSLQATAPGVAPATSATFAVAAGAPAALAIVTAPAGSAASGAPLGQQPVVQLRDSQGNDARQAGVTVTAEVASGPGTLGGTTSVVTGSDGRAVFTNLAINGAVGTYTLRFTATGLAPAVSGPIGVGAGSATQVTFATAPPGTAVNGQPLGGGVRVQLRDGTGNPVAQSGVAITASLSSGSGVLSGGIVAVTGVDGSATFATLTITGIVGNFVLTFASPGLSPAVSSSIILTAGAETAVSFVTAPGPTTINGALLPTAPVLQLRDISGNAVAKAGVAITASSQSVSLGVLQGTTTRLTDAQGRVTFADLRLVGQVGQYTLAFRAGTLSEALSNPIILQPGPPSAIAFSVFPALGAASGQPLSPQPTVQVVDQSANPVAQAGVAVTVALASGGGVLGGTLSATTGSGGAAVFTNLAITGPSGPHTLRFSAGGFPDLLSPTITIGAGAPTQLTFTTAPPATATNAVALAPAIVVQLRDGVGNPSPVAGVTITVTRTAGNATLGGTLSVGTSSSGTATFSALTLTGVTGNHELTFSAPGVTAAVSNTIVLQPGAATQLTFTTAPPATATNGVNLSPAVVVQLRDVSGNAVSTAGTTVTASLVTGAGGVLSGTTAVASAADGSATFSALQITGAVGQYTLRFSASGVTAATANPLTLQPGAATALAIATHPPPSASSGQALSPQPVIRVVDQSGNTVTTSTATVTASLASGPGSLGGTVAVQAVNGIATYANLAITGSTGTYTIDFAAAGLVGVTSGTIGLGAGAATALQFIGTPPTAATHGTAISPAITVRLVDAATNPVAQAGVSITAVLASGPGILGGTVNATTNASGEASFGNLVLTGAAGNYTIRFEVSGITPVTTAPIALAPGQAAQLAFVTAPSATAINAQPLATQPVVQVQDASGNAVSQSGLTITATATTNPGGTVANATATTGANGQATFVGLTITGTAGAYTLQFAGGTLTPVNANVSLQAGAAVAVKIVTQPSATATNAVEFTQQPVARLVDQSGNFTGSNGTQVSVALGRTPGPATLGGTTSVQTGPPGVRATFTDLKIAGTAGNYTLVFSSPGIASEESTTITLAAGGATQLVFTTSPPTTATNAATLTPSIGVRLADATGNPVAASGVSIAAAIATGSGATLGGTLVQQTDGTGAVSFDDLTLTGTVGNFTLTFTSGGLTAATTGTIVLGPGMATRLAFTTAPPTSGTNGAVLSPATVVQLRDQSDNVVSTSGVAVTADISAGAGGALSGTTLVNTTNGSASFDDLTITGQVGNYTLRFSSSGLTSVSAPNPLVLAAGSASQLAFSVAPPGSATSGSALTPQPQVQVQDQSGNPVAGSGRQVTATVSGGASLSNASATTDAGGLATFTGLAITGTAGNYTLTFASSGLPNLASNPISLNAGTATQLVFITAPPASATNGSVLAPQPVVELQDGTGNPVLTAGIPVTAALLSGSGSLLGTLVANTAADGRASFTNLELRGTPGNYSIGFTSGSLPALDSGPITLATGPASQLLFSQAPPASAVNRAIFPSNTIVQLSDVAGNLVASDGVTVTAAVATGPGASLGGTTARQTAGGLATFNDLVLTGTAGNYTLDFTSGTLTKATSNPIQLQPAAASKLVFSTTTPSTAQSGVVFSPVTVVQLQDPDNNSVSQSGVTVTADRFSGDASVVVAGGSAVTDGTGKATFSSLSLTGPAGPYALAFASSPLAGLISPTIDLVAGGAVKLGFVTAPPPTAINGEALAQQPEVQLLDAANNPVAEAGRNITMGWTGGQALTATSLTVATDAAGRAAFSGVTLTGTVGTGTLTFSGSGLSTLSSATITVQAGPATALAMVTQPPGTAVEDQALGTSPQVRLRDVSGNDVDSAGVGVTVGVTPAGATLGGTTTQATAAGGVATFPGLSLAGTAGTYQLAFSGTSLTGATSSDVVLAVPASLVITTEPPASGTNDVVLSPQPVVEVRDGASALLAGVAVTASLVTDAGAGTLAGTLTQVSGAGGTVTWTDLKIQGSGTFRLQFTTANGTTVTSTTPTVIP